MPNWKKIISQLKKIFFPTEKKNFANWAFYSQQLDSQEKPRCKDFSKVFTILISLHIIYT